MGAPIGNLNGVKWTTEQDEILKRLYAEGVSCRNIASYIPGKTRNSVIGRVHRMKLPLRGQNRRDPDKPVIRKKRTNLGRPGLLRPNQPRPSKDETVMRCAAIEPHHIALSDLTKDNCHWPYGDGPFTFCGHDRFLKSYCAAHFFLSIGPGTPSERAADSVSRGRLEGVR